MDTQTTESINPELDFLSKLNRRKIAFILISIFFIPCSVALSYADKSQIIKSPLVDILMFISLLAPAIQTYLLTSMLFTKTKSFFLAAVMFFPTIIIQIVILISVWVGIDRATALRKRA